MMWQERQNVVVFERSMWGENPTALHNSGKRKSATKASIFPSRVDVRAGRATKRAAKPRPSTNNRSESVSGVIMESAERWASLTHQLLFRRSESLFFRGKGSDVGHQPLDFIRFQGFRIRWHLVLPIRDDFGKLRIGRLLPLRGP